MTVETAVPATNRVFVHRFGYAVKMKSFDAASVWQAAPHLASCPTGGLLDEVAGSNVPDAAS